jgi:hypothetical protein
MAAPENISEAITQAALGPKSSTENGRSVQEHDLDQLIRVEKHLASKTAGQRNHMGLRFSQIVPPGAG